MPRKRKGPDPDATITESIGSLADDFLKRYREADPDAFAIDDRTQLNPATHSGRMFHPSWAAILSLYLWGSGFLYLDRTLLATFSLLVFLSLNTLFLSFAGILPSWLSDPLLRDIHWSFSRELSLIVLGGAIGFLWWTSILGATFLALRSLARPFRTSPKVWFQILVYPFPAIGQYVRGRFWKGHFDAFSLILGVLSFLALRSLWISARAEEINPSKEMVFAGFLILTLMGCVGFLLGYWIRAISILRDIEWLGDSSQGVYSEPKFVLLGSALVFFLFAKVMLGGPGTILREKGFGWCNEMETHGYKRSAAQVRFSLRTWKAASDYVSDRLSIAF